MDRSIKKGMKVIFSIVISRGSYLISKKRWPSASRKFHSLSNDIKFELFGASKHSKWKAGKSAQIDNALLTFSAKNSER
jgi:hypothetical protein